jgi:hypothetical protein
MDRIQKQTYLSLAQNHPSAKICPCLAHAPEACHQTLTFLGMALGTALGHAQGGGT